MQFDGTSATHCHFVALCLSVLSVEARIHCAEAIEGDVVTRLHVTFRKLVTATPGADPIYFCNLFIAVC